MDYHAAKILDGHGDHLELVFLLIEFDLEN